MNKVETSDNSAIDLDLLEKKIRRLVIKLERVSFEEIICFVTLVNLYYRLSSTINYGSVI